MFIDRLRRLLSEYPQIVLAVIFGSAANGRMHSGSDLDIALASKQPLSMEEKKSLIEKLAIEFSRPVDLIDLHTAGLPILSQVLTKGELVLCKDYGLYADLIKKMLFDTADFAPYRERILTERRKVWIGV